MGVNDVSKSSLHLQLADAYAGNSDEIDGTYYEVEENEEGARPFRCYLDIGLARTSTGARIWGCLKGGADGGLAIPYSENRFPGYDPETKEVDVETHKKYIFGEHVSEYMETLEEADQTAFNKQFSGYVLMSCSGFTQVCSVPCRQLPD
jgi:large subunit ribosomal protein L5e